MGAFFLTAGGALVEVKGERLLTVAYNRVSLAPLYGPEKKTDKSSAPRHSARASVTFRAWVCYSIPYDSYVKNILCPL